VATAKKATAKKAAAKKTAPARRDKLTLADVGWNRAVLQSNAELNRLFTNAVAGSWNAAKFQAELKNTKWYKNTSARWQQTEILRTTHPAEYKNGLAAARQAVINQAAKVGATLDEATLNYASSQLYRQGWQPEQLDAALSGYVKIKQGQVGGETGTSIDQLRALADANGVSYNDNYYQTAAQSIVKGTKTLQDYVNDVRVQAASAYPVYADQIKAGQNVKDIASPYIQRMGALLEINDQDINLNDSTIREAISGINPETGKAQAKSLWQFENDLRKDPRWAKTANALSLIHI
jgi:hypothetical protein